MNITTGEQGLNDELMLPARGGSSILGRTVYRLVLLCGLCACWSCVPTDQLRRNEYLLYGQAIRGNKLIPKPELEELIPQKPNRRILRTPLTPALWFYQLGARSYNADSAQRDLDAKISEYEQNKSSWGGNKAAEKRLTRRYNRQINRLRRRAEEGNTLMRLLGEPPAYFQSTDAKRNVEKIRKYLYDKGFFRANVNFTVDTLLGRRVRVTYLINEGIPFRLRALTYQIADPRVDSLVRGSLRESLLVTGDRYDADKVANERIRIEELLRNNGYYEFSRQFIPTPLDAQADTSLAGDGESGSRPVDLWIRIVNPPGRASHPIYRIGDVEMRITRDENQPLTDTIQRNGVRYLIANRRFSTRVLDSKLLLRPDSLYRIRNFRETQRQLFLLNQFKFTNINFTDTSGRRLQTRITAIPLDKYQLSTESGLNVSVFNQVFPGPFINLGMQVYNFFGGLETFEASLRGSFEVTPSFDVDPATGRYRPYNSRVLGFNTALTFPQVLMPTRFRFQFNRFNPKTQVNLGFNYTNRPEYVRSNLRAAMVYSWQRSNREVFNFSLADLNLLRGRIAGEFNEFLVEQNERGNPLIFSFRNALVSSMIFTYTYNSNILGQNRRANFFRITAESGGTTLNLLRTQSLDQFARQTGLQLSKYLRTNIDYRHYIPLRPRTTLALRLNTGLIFTYYSYDTISVGRRRFTAPYEKFFFGGGGNSNRAWLPRRLGPGSAYPFSRTNAFGVTRPEFRPPPYVGQFDYRYEQPGDILIEGSAELRGRLFHLGADFDGALFVDVGNVWTLRDDPNRRGENFRLDQFYRQMAVGAGAGLRLDFSFFIIRLDGAVKVYDPARRYIDLEGRVIDERYFLNQFTFRRMFQGPNPLVLNFGIGYPF